MKTHAPFITFEGPDGAGKSTQLQLTAECLRQRGWEVVCSREPGGTPLSEKVRELLLDTANRGMDPTAELFLYAAARAQHMAEVIRPALQAGKAVVLDRFTDSTVAYQGFGRQLGRELTEQVNTWATGGLMPDLTFVFLLEPEQARARMAGRALDRMETEGDAFKLRVYDGFCRLKDLYPGRIELLDARKSIDELSDEVLAILARRFPADD